MLEVVEEKSQFFKSLVEIDEQYEDNKSFIESVNSTIKKLQDGNKIDTMMLDATKLAEEE